MKNFHVWCRREQGGEAKFVQVRRKDRLGFHLCRAQGQWHRLHTVGQAGCFTATVGQWAGHNCNLECMGFGGLKREELS